VTTQTRADWARLTYPQLNALLREGKVDMPKAPPLAAVREWMKG
jgi:hypothetical protein